MIHIPAGLRLPRRRRACLCRRLVVRHLAWLVEGEAHERGELVLQHELATLVGFAFHQPSKMPDYKPPAEASAPPPRKAEAGWDVDHERVRGLLMGMALRGRG